VGWTCSLWSRCGDLCIQQMCQVHCCTVIKFNIKWSFLVC
jgi:hypothetical protein